MLVRYAPVDTARLDLGDHQATLTPPGGTPLVITTPMVAKATYDKARAGLVLVPSAPGAQQLSRAAMHRVSHASFCSIPSSTRSVVDTQLLLSTARQGAEPVTAVRSRACNGSCVCHRRWLQRLLCPALHLSRRPITPHGVTIVARPSFTLPLHQRVVHVASGSN